MSRRPPIVLVLSLALSLSAVAAAQDAPSVDPAAVQGAAPGAGEAAPGDAPPDAASDAAQNTDVPENAEDSETRARAAYERGAAAYDIGRYEEALLAFGEAYELSNRPPLLYNIALAQDRLRMDAAALRTFELYLEAVPTTPHRQQVESRIASLTQAEQRREAEVAALEEARREEEARRMLAEEEARRASASKPSRWWIGLIVGIVVVGAGVGLGVGLSNRDDGFEQSDFGEVTTTLGSF